MTTKGSSFCLKMNYPYRSKQRGVALITVLMVVAIVAIMATEMSNRLQLNIKRQANQQQLNQAYWYAMSAEVLAKNILKQVREDDPDSVHLQQLWASEGMVFPVDGGSIAGKISDLQSCFNLNVLQKGSLDDDGTQDEYYVASLIRLLNSLSQGVGNAQGEVALDPYTNEVFAHSLADWLDENNMIRSAYGAEDSEYESTQIPYEAANSLMANLSEVRAVRNGLAPIYENLKEDYGCVIPGSDQLKINVNTVAAEKAHVIAALLPGLSVDDAANVLSSRDNDGFDTIEEFWSQPELTALPNIDNQMKSHFGITSDYFLLESETTYNESRFKLASVLYIDEQNNVSVIAREIGGRP